MAGLAKSVERYRDGPGSPSNPDASSGLRGLGKSSSSGFGNKTRGGDILLTKLHSLGRPDSGRDAL